MTEEEREVLLPQNEDGDGDEESIGMTHWDMPPHPPTPACFTPPLVAAKGLGERHIGLSESSRYLLVCLERGCGPDNTIFCDPSKAQYTLRWVIRRLSRT